MADLDQFLEAFANLTDEEMIYSVGWIDGMAQGTSLGRGILEVSRPIDSTAPHNPVKRRSVPFNFPNFAINSWSVKAFNEVYYRRIPKRGRESQLPYDVFLFPLRCDP